jgi:hypothetical protein
MMNTFCAGVKAEVQAMIAHIAGSGGGKGAGPSFAGPDHKGGGKGSGIDKKEVAVWKLPEDVTKVQYRHWSNAVDIQLEAVHAWIGADFVLNRIKRCKEPMTELTFNACLVEAGVDVSADTDVHLDAPHPDDWPFAERTRFLYTYLMGKISTDLYDRVAAVEGKNGFEVYRQIAQMIDAVPENAEFVLNSELLQLASTHGAKVRDLKSLFAFRLLLKKRNAEFRKTIGKPPQDDQSKLILWNVFDPESKRLAAAENVAAMNYENMAKWIDERHRIIYGTLD